MNDSHGYLLLSSRAADRNKGLSAEFLMINAVKGEIVAEDKFDYESILSRRELEILQYIGQGFISKEIDDFLFISINTVSRHRRIF